ncbi:MAG TPA: AraC family transcriptional regulator [Clostridiales bacterium]|nr:AraC family transcriptional regulator [Clostridiales bacterium]
MQDFSYTAADSSFLLSLEKQRAPHQMVVNHWHDSYEIYYLLSGERCYFIKNQTYRLTRGSLVLIQPQELHRTLAAAGVGCWERILINFRPDFLIAAHPERIAWLSELFRRPYRLLQFSLKEQTAAEEILMQMLHEASQQETGFLEMLAAHLVRLLLLAVRQKPSGPEAPDSRDTWQNNRAAPIVSYLNEHYPEALSLAGLAQRFHLSDGYLCKIFRAATGFTVIEYLNQVRIREAQNLLRQTPDSVLEIAGRVGFGNVSHFGRIFKEITGTPPVSYRKRYR